MGTERSVIKPSTAPPEWLRRGKPRIFAEWKALYRWGKLPPWEQQVPGYLLRLAREEAGLSQAALGSRLGVSQQAIAQAERWNANPTVAFMTRWTAACGARLRLEVNAESRSECGMMKDE